MRAESPQWRKGPKCKPILCNACGTRFLRTRSLGKASVRPGLDPWPRPLAWTLRPTCQQAVQPQPQPPGAQPVQPQLQTLGAHVHGGCLVRGPGLASEGRCLNPEP